MMLGNDVVKVFDSKVSLETHNGEVGKKGVARTARKVCLTTLNEWREQIENFNKDYDLLIVPGFIVLDEDNNEEENDDEDKNSTESEGSNA